MSDWDRCDNHIRLNLCTPRTEAIQVMSGCVCWFRAVVLFRSLQEYCSPFNQEDDVVRSDFVKFLIRKRFI